MRVLVVADPGEDLDFWIRHVKFGVQVSLALIAATGPYLVFGARTDSRPTLVAVIVATTVMTLVVHRLNWRRILAGPHPLVFLYVWSFLATTAITAAAAADGGINSPLLLYYALPMLFAAIAYPPRAVAVLSASMVGAVGFMGLATTSVTEPDRAWLTMAVLVLSSWSFTHAAGNYRRSAQRSEALAQQLREQANIDSLTGCLNHRSFQRRLASEAERSQRSGQPLGLLMGDLDRFKEINDRHGHGIGDAILELVGAGIRDALRAGDEVARVGGEEFAILLPNTDARRCLEVAERMRRLVGALDSPVPVTISFGVSVLPELAETADELVEFADLGLYSAKRNGRDCVAVHRHGATNGMRHGTTVAGRVSDLLASDALSSDYQPIIDLRSGEVVAYEALARVAGSRLRPDQWLALAETTGQRIELEGAMLDAALDGWPDPQPDDVTLFINLSPDALAAGIAWSRLDRLGPHVVIEVSERDPITDYAALRTILGDLSVRGVRLAIDDVGAGHANMRHVMELRPAFVKLDRSLIAGVDSHDLRASFIGAMADFTTDIGVTLIGEGIERPEEAEALRSIGVDLGQGYLIARPASPPPAAQWTGVDHAALAVRGDGPGISS